MTTNTIKRLASLIRKGDRIVLPGNMIDPYDIEVYTVEDAWSAEGGWVYLNVGLDAPIRLPEDLSIVKILPVPHRNSAGTMMVRIEGQQLKMLQDMMIHGTSVKPYLLRVDQRSDSVAFKVNEGMWSPGLGTPQAPY